MSKVVDLKEKNNKKIMIIIVIVILVLLMIFFMKNKNIEKKEKLEKNTEVNTNTNAMIYFDKLHSTSNEKDSSIQSDTQVNMVSNLSSTTLCQDTFTFKANNHSKSDVYISSIHIIDSDGVLNDINYIIKDSDDKVVEPGTILKSNESKEYRIIVYSTKENCPSQKINLSLKFNFSYQTYEKEASTSTAEVEQEKIVEEQTTSNTKTEIKKNRKKNKEIKQDILPATAKKNRYTVTLNSINGTYDVILMTALEKESVRTELSAKEGYHFDKVQCSNNYNADVKNNTLSIKEVKENINCTVYYTENTYELSIDPNGGIYRNSNEIIRENQKYNSTIQLEEPTKEGYIFEGWEIRGKNTKVNNNVLTMGKDSILKAKWKVETHEINVRAVNGQGGSATVDYNQDTSIRVVANETYSYDTTLGSKIVCDNNTQVQYNSSEQRLEFKNVKIDANCTINFIKLEELMPIHVASQYAYTHGDEYSIVVNKDTNERHTFYVISSTKDTVSLIMSENYIAKAATTKYGSARYPSTIFNAVPTVEEWNNIPSPGTYTDNFGYNAVTVDYSSYAARIPTYGEVYAACNSGGCKNWIKGTYWTSSPKYDSTSTMNLYYMNNSSISYKSYSTAGGYRPVITLPKSYFNGVVDENNIPSIVRAESIQSNNKYTNGDKYSIVVNKDTNETHDFYILKTDADSVYMIMSENYITKGATSTYGRDRYPVEILKLLPTVSDWNNIPSPGIVTDADGSVIERIDYNAYAARIPTYTEILAECTTGVCLDWIRGSYWTSTPKKEATTVMNLYYMNNSNISSKSYSTTGGYRPVIKLPKKYFRGIINEETEVNFVSKNSTISDNTYTVGDKYSIVVNKDTNETHDFYVLSVTGDRINLIMSENYTAKGTTSKYGTERYPKTIFSLVPTVEEWNNIPSPGQFVDSSGDGTVNINYSAYAARFPTYHEILGQCATGTCQNWIKGSYWTSTPKKEATTVMNLYYMNDFNIGAKSYSTAGGYRPVISIPKSYFKDLVNENVTPNIVSKISIQNNYSFNSGDEYQIQVNSEGEKHNFYVISTTSNTVSLIMSENYIAKGFTSIYGTERYPKTIFNLVPTVSEWNNIPSPGIFTDADGANSVTINYGIYAARFPTYHEVLGQCLNGTCQNWIKGSYWTSSPKTTSGSVMNLNYMNNSTLSYQSYSTAGGYRPVITLPKTYFKDIINENEYHPALTEIDSKSASRISAGDKYNIVVNNITNENHDFYVLSSDSDKVSLIMDSNYTVNGTTLKYGTERYPSTIIGLLPKSSDWNAILSPGIFKDDTGSNSVVINYGLYPSRFPTYRELLSVCPMSTSCPTWIRGSYWTSSPKNEATTVMNLYYMNNFNIATKSYSTVGGYRPVITLPRKYFNK